MRRTLPILALALVLALPAANALSSAAELALDARTQANANATIPIVTTLTLSDFACASGGSFDVSLSANATGAAVPTFDATSLSFVVPAGSYLMEPWSGSATVNLTVQADAEDDITIVATFAANNGGDCFAPDGFPSASAEANIHVTPVAPTPRPPPAENQTAPTNPTTNTTNETPTEPPANSTTTQQNGTVDQLPAGGGYIGDYAPTESKSTPAPALVGVVAMAGAVALSMRRRQR